MISEIKPRGWENHGDGPGGPSGPPGSSPWFPSSLDWILVSRICFSSSYSVSTLIIKAPHFICIARSTVPASIPELRMLSRLSPFRSRLTVSTSFFWPFFSPLFSPISIPSSRIIRPNPSILRTSFRTSGFLPVSTYLSTISIFPLLTPFTHFRAAASSDSN